MKKINKTGISLIVLIVTIIVIIILAAVVILTIQKNNPVESAKEAAFKEDIRAYQDELNMYITKEYQSMGGQRDTKITATGYEKDSTSDEYINSVYKYLNSFKKKYEGKIAIKDDKIAYVGFDEKEREWLLNSGIYMSSKITINYIDGDGNKLIDSEIKSQLEPNYSFKAPEIEGYIALNELEEGTITGDITINFEYCAICNELTYVGLDSSGNETSEEGNIVSYMVSGVAENFNTPYLAIPRVYNDKPVTKIKQYAFNGNKSIKYLAIEDNILSVGERAFMGTSVEKVKVNAKSLNRLVFQACYSLTDVILDNNLKTSSDQIFFGDNNIKNVRIYSESTSLVFGSIFHGCNSNYLDKVIINSDNNTYCQKDGILYNKDLSTIIFYPIAKKGEFIIDDSIKNIFESAFQQSKNLKEIYIPETVSFMAMCSFQGSLVEEVYVNTKTINRLTFYQASKLKKVTLGKNVKNLAGDWIFAATSSSLVSIHYEGTMDEWNLINKDGRWKDNSNITKIICSDGTIEL